MLRYRTFLAFFLFAALTATPSFATRVHRGATSGHSHSLHKGVKGTRATKAAAAPRGHKMHGQQSIEPARVTEIQTALIREHYLTSEANGMWDSTTQAAMQKYQADQGWQTKLMPDSRAIKKLGLGPDYSNAINAKNSSFADPPATSTIPAAQSEKFAEAAGVSR